MSWVEVDGLQVWENEGTGADLHARERIREQLTALAQEVWGEFWSSNRTGVCDASIGDLTCDRLAGHAGDHWCSLFAVGRGVFWHSP